MNERSGPNWKDLHFFGIVKNNHILWKKTFNNKYFKCIILLQYWILKYPFLLSVIGCIEERKIMKIIEIKLLMKNPALTEEIWIFTS